MTIDDLIGKLYARGGRGPEAYDCAGLVVEVMRRRGIVLEVPATPESEHDQLAATLAILAAQWIGIDHPRPGCLVFFKGVPGHVGVVLPRERFVHSAEMRGAVCVERLDDPLWKRKFQGFYEYGGPRR